MQHCSSTDNWVQCFEHL